MHLPQPCVAVLLAPSTAIGTPESLNANAILNWSPFPTVCAEWSWSDPDLALCACWGGEVRITEAERSDRIPAGRRGCGTGIAARSARTGQRCAVLPVCGACQRICGWPVRPNAPQRSTATLYTAVSCSPPNRAICLIKVAPTRADASAPAAGRCVGDARLARARHRRAGPVDQPGSSGLLSDAAKVIFLAAQSSNSRSAPLDPFSA